MKKIRLALETIAVESFRVMPEPSRGAGTVAAHGNTEEGAETCNQTCLITCEYFTCNGDLSNCVCEPGGETEHCGGQTQVYSCAWTRCNNCYPTPNEAMSCQVIC